MNTSSELNNVSDSCNPAACHQHFCRVEDHITFLDKRLIEHIATLRMERDAASVILDKRLSSMNEFREALKDQTALLLTRKEHELYIQALEADMRVLRESRAELAGKASQSTVIITFLISVGGLVSGFVALLIKLSR